MLGNALRASRAVCACDVQHESHKQLWDIAGGALVQCCVRCIPAMV